MNPRTCTICRGQRVAEHIAPVDEHGQRKVTWTCQDCGAPQGSLTTSAEYNAIEGVGPAVAGFLRACADAWPTADNGWSREDLAAQVELVRVTHGQPAADILGRFLADFADAIFAAEIRTARMNPDGPHRPQP